MTPSEGSRGTTLSRARESPDSPGDQRSYRRDMNTMTSDDIQSRRVGPRLRAAGFAVAATFAGLIPLIVYGVAAQPILETCSGGAAGSMTTAVFVGLGLVSVATYLTAKTGRGGRIFMAFLAAYAAGLLVLWELSPIIWGARTCSSQGLF